LLCTVGVTADAPAREVAARLISRLASRSAAKPSRTSKANAVGTKP